MSGGAGAGREVGVSLFWLHALAGTLAVAAWVAVVRNGQAIVPLKVRSEVAALPLAVRSHARTGALWLGLTALAVLTGYLAPNGGSTAAALHRAAAAALLPLVPLGAWLGSRLVRGEPPSALAHVASLGVASLFALVLAVTGSAMLVRVIGQL